MLSRKWKWRVGGRYFQDDVYRSLTDGSCERGRCVDSSECQCDDYRCNCLDFAYCFCFSIGYSVDLITILLQLEWVPDLIDLYQPASLVSVSRGDDETLTAK